MSGCSRTVSVKVLRRPNYQTKMSTPLTPGTSLSSSRTIHPSPHLKFGVRRLRSVVQEGWWEVTETDYLLDKGPRCALLCRAQCSEAKPRSPPATLRDSSLWLVQKQDWRETYRGTPKNPLHTQHRLRPLSPRGPWRRPEDVGVTGSCLGYGTTVKEVHTRVSCS